MRISACLRVLAIAATACAGADEEASRAPDSVKLPDAVVPEHYTLLLAPEPRNMTFYGKAVVHAMVRKPTKLIHLHASRLTIEEVEVTMGARKKPLPLNVTWNNSDPILILAVRKTLRPKTKLMITIVYHGQINYESNGMFESGYLDGNVTRYIYASDLEPSYARTVFPCWDEPGYKTTFQLKLARYRENMTLSNMPLNRTSPPIPKLDKRVLDIYDKTPPMSTYLVGFMFGDFEHRGTSRFGIAVRPNAVDQTAFGLRVGPQLLETLEDYCGQKYPLPKLDNVAIPGIRGEAVEKWGIVIYAESMLLLDEENAESADKQTVVQTIAHELAHMWFGNLVTPEWWDVLWLKEGFASYMEYYIPAKVFPDWRMDEQFVINMVHSALEEDVGDVSTMTNVINTQQDISDRYGPVSYQRGAAFLRMLASILTEDTFQDIVRKFLAQNEYGTVNEDTLLATVSKLGSDFAPGIDLEAAIRTWTQQSSYPLLTVERDYDSGRAILTQQRFLPMDNNANLSWWLPVSYTTQAEANFASARPRIWLAPNRTEDYLEGLPGRDQWMIVNINHTGMYRVNYDSRNWRLLAEALDSEAHGGIPPLQRAQIVDDAFHLLRCGLLDIGTVLRIIGFLARDTDYIPWMRAEKHLNQMLTYGRGNAGFHLIQSYIHGLVKNVYNTLQFDEKPDDDFLTKKLRNIVMEIACGAEFPECIKVAKAKFRSYSEDPTTNRIPPDLRTAVLRVGLRDATLDEWRLVLQQYFSSDCIVERLTILYTLGWSNNPDIISYYLTQIFSLPPRMLRADIAEAMLSMEPFSATVEGLIRFLDVNHTGQNEYGVWIFSIIVPQITKMEDYEKVEQWLSTKEQYNTAAAVRASLDAAKNNALQARRWAAACVTALQGDPQPIDPSDVTCVCGFPNTVPCPIYGGA